MHNVRGSCLCGSVIYEVALTAQRFVYCHCSRCRKATGSVHASNLIVPARALTWISGEGLVRRYDLPTAKSFATCFCQHCGSPLPHLTRSGREAIVPAGSLDEDPKSFPEGHICWESRASWYRADSEIPITGDMNPTNI